MVEKLYADRDPAQLEPWYSKHVNAMTAESLHSKADIAAELAWRDSKLEAWERSAQEGHPNPCTLGPLCPYCEIERLQSQLDEAKARCK